MRCFWTLLYFIILESDPNIAWSYKRTVSYLGYLGHLTNLVFSHSRVLFVFLSLVYIFWRFFRFNFAVVCFDCFFRLFGCQIKCCWARTAQYVSMFNALIYRKRMEQTEYLIHSTTIELDLHVFILIRRFSIKTVIIDLKVRSVVQVNYGLIFYSFRHRFWFVCFFFSLFVCNHSFFWGNSKRR